VTMHEKERAEPLLWENKERVREAEQTMVEDAVNFLQDYDDIPKADRKKSLHIPMTTSKETRQTRSGKKGDHPGTSMGETRRLL